MKFLENDDERMIWPGSPLPGMATPAGPEPIDPATFAQDFGEVSSPGAFWPTMRLENPITSYAVSEASGAPKHRQEGYNAWDEIKGTDYEEYWDRFTNSHNPERTLAIKRDIHRELLDRSILADAPISQRFAYGLVAGLVDPLLLVPGGAFVRGAKGGFTAMKSALSVGASTGAMTAAQEVALHATQQTRTLGESYTNVGASTLLGGLLGAGGAKLLTNAEIGQITRKVEEELMFGSPKPQMDKDAILDWNYRNPPVQLENEMLGSVAEARNVKTRELFKHSVQTFTRRWEQSVEGLDEAKELEIMGTKMSPLERNIWNEDEAGASMPASLSAAARTSPTLEALAIAGKTETVAAVTRWLNPNLRTAMSESAEVRMTGLRLSERSYYLEGNASGMATPQAAETFARMWRGALITSIEENDNLFNAYRKRGGQLTRTEFDQATGRVLLTGEKSLEPEVNANADSWRKKQAGPGEAEARSVGVLKEGEDLYSSYYGRIFNRVKIAGDEFAFKAAIRQWIKDVAPELRSAAVMERIGRLGKATKGKSKREADDMIKLARHEVESVFDDIDSLADDVARIAFDRAMGRGGTVEQFNQIKVGQVEMTFAPPNKVLLPWLEQDVRAIGDRMALTLGGDTEITRMFGSIDMRDSFDKIRGEYEQLRTAAKDQPNVLARLEKAEKRDIADLKGMRDILRGTYREAEMNENFARFSRVATKFNYIRMMGMVVLASIPEVVRTAGVHGLSPFMETMGQAITSPKAFKASVHELKLAGLVGDRIMAHRLATMADIFNSYHNRGPVERVLDGMVDVANQWNGLRVWTDYMKMIAGVTTQNRILRIAENYNGASARDKAYMAYLGIDESGAERINAMFNKHGEKMNNVRVANTEEWGADEVGHVTARMFRAAVAKDVDTIVVHRSVGDIPLFANTPMGRLIFQFNTFNIASHQRILMRGLQEGPTRFLSSLAAMTSLGMLQTYIRSILNNRDVPEMSENPGWWIGEGLDYSGVFMIPMQMGNISEKAIGFNPIKSALKTFDEGDSRSMRMRDVNFSHIFGPSVGTIEDFLRVAQIPTTYVDSGEVSKGQMGAAERLLPYNSYLGLRSFLRYIANPPEN